MHHILKIIQGNISSFLELTLLSETKQITSQGTIPASFNQPPLVKLQSFEAAVMALFQLDVSNNIHSITYTVELADQHQATTLKRASTNTTQQGSKKTKGRPPLEQPEYEKDKVSGFLRKVSNTTSAHTWRELINYWNAPTLCHFYCIHGFFAIMVLVALLGATVLIVISYGVSLHLQNKLN